MNLPDDIIDDILLRLPVKSLGSFKVVCKDWYFHINSHSFIAKHTKNQIGNEKLLIYHGLEGRGTVSICSEEEKQDDENDEEEEEDEDGMRTLFHQSMHRSLEYMTYYRDEVKIVGTCNGIVCLQIKNLGGYAKSVTLWNPTTREFNTLPRFQPQRPPGALIVIDHIGFGYDCTTDDYKVIRILYFMKEENRWPEEYIIQMKIYSLSTNSWREFDCSCLSARRIALTPNYSMLFGNKFCWLARNIGGNIQSLMILSFDMGKEVFQKTQLPPECVHFVEKYYSYYVHEYVTELFHMHDSIALVLYARRYWEKTFEIWTTKDVEEGRSSWIKFARVGPISGIERPLGFRKCQNSNNFLCLLYHYDLGEFEPDMVKFKNFMKGIYMNNQGQIKNSRSMTIKVKNSFDLHCIALPKQVFTYVETFVSVNRS